MKKQKGFTLIELLVVIAIIGLLAGIVLVSMSGVRAGARDAKRQADLRQISTAMETCYDATSCGPGSQQYLTDAGPTAPAAIGSFMTSVPSDPTDDGVRQYWWVNNAGDSSDYCIFAILEEEATAGNSMYVAIGPGGLTKGEEVEALNDGDLITDYPFSLADCENIL